MVDNPSSAEVMTQGQNTTFNVQGGRTTGNNITIDGVSNDTTNGTTRNNFVNMDSVQTVRILVSNYQAEFGRKPGASIMAVTKSGTGQYHGIAYQYYRHEWMNANDFFNNARLCRKLRAAFLRRASTSAARSTFPSYGTGKRASSSSSPRSNSFVSAGPEPSGT